MMDNSSRSEQLLGLCHVGVESLVRIPVREAVREALAEERARADERDAHALRTGTDDRTGNATRTLRPALLLPILGLAVIGVVAKRRGLLTALLGRDDSDEDDGPASTVESTRRNTADSGPTAVESTGYDDHDVDADSDKLSRTDD